MRTSITRYFLTALLPAGIVTLAGAASTIDATSRYTYAANVGWMDWRANGTNGVSANRQYLGGYIYAANIGWINLGDGSPANGTAYSNSSAGDCGVNCTSSGTDLNLSGYAYGANVGWISFNVTGANRPRIEKATGKFHGYIYGANFGWIALEQASNVLVTDSSLTADPTPTASPTATPSPSATASPTASMTPSATPSVSPSPIPLPEVVQVLLRLRAATAAEDVNDDGIVDAADLESP